jgi:squalene/oxidosqualene cyclase-like protein
VPYDLDVEYERHMNGGVGDGSVTDGTTPVSEALHRGFRYLQSIQSAHGGWTGDYDGPLFLLPGYIFLHRIVGRPLSEADRTAFIATLRRAQTREGSFGLHLDGKGYLFTTVLNYVALRLMGVGADDPDLRRAHAWIHRNGGAGAVPSWGKYWLSILNLYSWEGCHPVPPELWILPRALPIHPSHFWCHCRVVVLAVSYLYGRRFQAPVDPLVSSLRNELFAEPFDAVDWPAMRDRVCPVDRYFEPSRTLRVLNTLLGLVERWMPRSLRAKALAMVLDHIKHEQLTTNFIDIGPVNKVLDTLAVWSAEPQSEHTRKALDALPQYIFDCDRGRTMQSYNSSELWDTGFVALALADSGLAGQFAAMARETYRFIDENQVRDDVDQRERYFRDPSKGGWPFSNRAHGWPIVDCTALGLMGALALAPHAQAPMETQRLLDAVDLLLFWRNKDGGWATYERQRVGAWLENLNASEIFGDIMVDVSQVELTSSAIQGLNAARGLGDRLTPARARHVDAAMSRGAKFIRALQRPDGSWEGNWGICFTYGTWFGIWGLRDAGARADDPAVVRAADFLRAKQCDDGGWGESHESCLQRRYVQHPDGGQVVMTAWAVLALVKASPERHRDAIKAGVRFLLERQLPNGDWPVQGMTGVFNRTCMLNYRFYRNYFPLWALALASKHEIQ